jgi:hypothetical protein
MGIRGGKAENLEKRGFRKEGGKVKSPTRTPRGWGTCERSRNPREKSARGASREGELQKLGCVSPRGCFRFYCSVVADAVGQPGDGSEHSEPAQSTHEAADFLILGKQSPLSEKNRPVALLRADERQGGRASVGHVGADVGKIFKEPKTAESEAGRFPLPEEVRSAQRRNEQFAERAAENHDGVAEPAKEKMPALVDDQIDVVEDEKPRTISEGIKKKERVKAEPGNPAEARNGLPLTELVFKEVHFAKSSKKEVSHLRRSRFSCQVPQPSPFDCAQGRRAGLTSGAPTALAQCWQRIIASKDALRQAQGKLALRELALRRDPRYSA